MSSRRAELTSLIAFSTSLLRLASGVSDSDETQAPMMKDGEEGKTCADADGGERLRLFGTESQTRWLSLKLGRKTNRETGQLGTRGTGTKDKGDG